MFIFDTETTGLDYTRDALWQVSCLIEDTETNMIVDKLDLKMQPKNPERIDEKLLDIFNIDSVDTMNGYMDRELAFRQFMDFIKKYSDGSITRTNTLIPCGYNVMFDMIFLQKFFKEFEHLKYTFANYIDYHTIDIMQVVHLFAFAGALPENCTQLKLVKVAAAYGIPVSEERAHNAMYDVALTKKLKDILFKKLTIDDK